MRQADLRPPLDELIAALSTGGFGPEAEHLIAARNLPTTSSLEIVGEIGLELLRIDRDVGQLLPRSTRRLLRHCLAIVRRSWPGLRVSSGGP